MKYIEIIILVALVALSLAAGAAKVMASPQEVQFFAEAGLSSNWVLPIGLLQIFGGVAAIFGRSRRVGLIAIAAGFLFSTGVIFLTGNTVFGLISLLPVLLAGFAIWRGGPATS